MNFDEWERIMSYANNKSYGSKRHIINDVYSMYDGRHGIRFTLLDSRGKPFKWYATGIHDNYSDMKTAIDMAIRTLEAI